MRLIGRTYDDLQEEGRSELVEQGSLELVEEVPCGTSK
jgi:hypothetical protein